MCMSAFATCIFESLNKGVACVRDEEHCRFTDIDRHCLSEKVTIQNSFQCISVEQNNFIETKILNPIKKCAQKEGIYFDLYFH